jgi:hypothetical protein
MNKLTLHKKLNEDLMMSCTTSSFNKNITIIKKNALTEILENRSVGQQKKSYL